MTIKTVLLINGPNLNLLGHRNPTKYGTTTLDEIEESLKANAAKNNLRIECFQSNHEGELIDYLHKNFLEAHSEKKKLGGIIINPGAWTHTSIALRDALEIYEEKNIPIYEVHLSQIHKREEFRHHSYISGIATGVICGLGDLGYEAALNVIIKKNESSYARE